MTPEEMRELLQAEVERTKMWGTYGNSPIHFSYTKTPVGAEPAQPILRVKRLHPEAKLPTYATDGSARFDLYCHHAAREGARSVGAHYNITCGTGIAVEVPPGWELNVVSRSGLAIKGGLALANGVGIIDSDYRGEVIVVLTNYDDSGYDEVQFGDRIAQAMLVRAPRCTILEVEELTETQRGSGGFGSTGR